MRRVKTPLVGAAAPVADAPRPNRSVPMLAVAVALVVGVGALILVFGVVRAPALAGLTDSGARAPASIAWTQWDDAGQCTAIRLARPDGSARTLTCQRDLGDIVGWPGEGVVAVSWTPTGQMLETYDATTGERVARRATDGAVGPEIAANVATVRTDGHLIVTLDPSNRVVWDVAADAGYDVRAGVISPDGRWVVLLDSSNRLLLVPADGSAPPIVWQTDVEGSGWLGPVWEGTPVPTNAK